MSRQTSDLPSILRPGHGFGLRRRRESSFRGEEICEWLALDLDGAAGVGVTEPQLKERRMSELLRLIAFDDEDLKVISANLQDALVRVGDMAYLPKSKQFAIVASRFDWVKAMDGGWERCRTGVHFERVLKAQCMGFAQKDRGALLNLLSIGFKETEAPAGVVEIIFSAGCALRLEVECLEAEMHDFCLRWRAGALPLHPFADESEAAAK